MNIRPNDNIKDLSPPLVKCVPPVAPYPRTCVKRMFKTRKEEVHIVGFVEAESDFDFR